MLLSRGRLEATLWGLVSAVRVRLVQECQQMRFGGFLQYMHKVSSSLHWSDTRQRSAVHACSCWCAVREAVSPCWCHLSGGHVYTRACFFLLLQRLTLLPSPPAQLYSSMEVHACRLSHANCPQSPCGAL